MVGIRADTAGPGTALDATGPGRVVPLARSGARACAASFVRLIAQVRRASSDCHRRRSLALGLDGSPAALLALATVKNAHYAIAAQVPWSIWAALALARLGETLRRRGWNRSTLRSAADVGFATIALLYGMCLWLLRLASIAGASSGLSTSRSDAVCRQRVTDVSLRRLGPHPVRVPLRLVSARSGRPSLLSRSPGLLAPGQQLSSRDQPRRALPRPRFTPIRQHDRPLRPGSSRVCCRRPRSRLTRARETRSCRNPRPRTNHPERPSVLTVPHLTRPGRKQPRPPGQAIDSALNP